MTGGLLALDDQVPPMASHPALVVDGLEIDVASRDGVRSVVTDVSFEIGAGEALALVGESGSGKTLTLRAVLGLLPPGIAVRCGSIRFGRGTAPPVEAPPALWRGRGLTLVPQEPMTAMNPTMRLADLVAAGPRAAGVPKRVARARALDLLADVGIPSPAERADAWPHELSGGMRQRAMIAMALATEPSILLCDEPTTALDVTVQHQIVQLLDRIRRERGLALVFVTHDLALAAELCDRVAVMYAGQIVETGPIAEAFATPAHRYTAALLAALPDPARRSDRLVAIPGRPPIPAEFGTGCRFAARCDAASELCLTTTHELRALHGGVGIARSTSCVHPPAPWGPR